MLHQSSSIGSTHHGRNQDRMNQYHAHATGNTTPTMTTGTTSYVVTNTVYDGNTIGTGGLGVGGGGGGSGTVTERYSYFPEIIDDRASYPNLSPIYEIIQDVKRKNVVTVAATATGPAQMPLLDYSSDPWGPSELGWGGVMDEHHHHQQQQQILQPEKGRPVLTSSTTGSAGVVGEGPTSPQRQPQLRRPSWDVRYAHQQQRSTFGYANSQIRPSNPATTSDEDWRRRQQQQQQQEEGGGGGIRQLSSGESFGTVTAAAAAGPRLMKLNTWLDSPRIERLEAPLHADELLKVTPQLRILSPLSTDMDVAVGTHSTSGNIIINLFSNAANTINSNNNNKHERGTSRYGVPSSSSRYGQSGRNGTAATSGTGSNNTSNNGSAVSDYKISQKRDRANRQAAAELASLLWICAHEVSLEDYGMVETTTFTSVFALVHSQDMDRRIAGVAALDALIDAPSADEERKAIKFANTLSGSLRSAQGDYELLSAVSKALGHMATRTANVDFVESEVTRALEWLRTERSDRRYVLE